MVARVLFKNKLKSELITERHYYDAVNKNVDILNIYDYNNIRKTIKKISIIFYLKIKLYFTKSRKSTPSFWILTKGQLNHFSSNAIKIFLYYLN